VKRDADVKISLLADRRAVWSAWGGWAVMFLAAVAIILHDSSRSVVPIYRFAALQWTAGQRMYELSGIGGFTYFPQAAILFVPFAMLPPVLGEALWRLASIGVFAAGLRGFSSLAGERQGKELFPLMSLAAVPLVWDCARNGQATLMMTGFMLLAVVDAARSRWWKGVLWLALAVAVKPLAIVLVLLIAAIDRPMTWRVLLGMALLAVIPFLTQRPGYVIEQYRACFENMSISAHVGVTAHGWTTPFTALRAAGLDVPEKVQTLVRLAAAAATLALCFFTRRRHGAARSAITVFTLSALYVILFSPRTENNTYAMLGPAIGASLAGAFLVEKRAREGALLAGMLLILSASRLIERLLTPAANESWIPPLFAACFGMYVLVRLFAKPMKRSGPEVRD
jgi:alpha-1,2-mannosyltransferase